CGLDRLADTDDIGYGGGWSDGKAIAIAHAGARYSVAHDRPIHAAGPVYFQGLPSGARKNLQAVHRQYTMIPERALETGIRSTLFCQLAACKNGKVADRFHARICKLDGFR